MRELDFCFFGESGQTGFPSSRWLQRFPSVKECLGIVRPGDQFQKLRKEEKAYPFCLLGEPPALLIPYAGINGHESGEGSEHRIPICYTVPALISAKGRSHRCKSVELQKEWLWNFCG